MRNASCFCKVAWLLFGALSVVQIAKGQAAPEEKVSEGQYARMKGSSQLPEGGQDWVLRRAGQGYVLESKFRLRNAGAEFFAGMASSGVKMSPEMRKEIESEVVQTGIQVELSPDYAVQAVVVQGERLRDKKPAEIANCRVLQKEIRCKGFHGGVRAGMADASQLFYSFPFPMLLSPLVVHAEKAPERAALLRLKVLEVQKSRPYLLDAKGRVEYVGDEVLVIGDRSFSTGKYRLLLEVANKAFLKLEFWSSRSGLVLAIADENDFPGERIALVQYKRHASFP